MNLNVKYLFPDIPELVSRAGDSGYDIRAAIDKPLQIAANERVSIPTGIAVEVSDYPKTPYVSLELQIRPRSGLTHQGIIAQFGTIDESYRGEIWVTLINANNLAVTVQPLDRIAQLVVCPIYKPKVSGVKNLTPTERGTKGFGSTGRN